MKSLNYLNKFFFKYRLRILIGILITIIARFFALVAPNLIGESITIIDNYLSNGGDPTIIRKSLIKNISFIVGAAFLAGLKADLFEDLSSLEETKVIDKVFLPDAEEGRYQEWKEAVKKILS